MSEVTGLRVGDIVLDGTTAAHLHGKGRKDRSVPLWRSTAALIRGWKRRLEGTGDNKFLFPSRSGERMARSNVTQRLDLAVSTAAEKCPQLAGRSISPHTIRHYVSLLTMSRYSKAPAGLFGNCWLKSRTGPGDYPT